MVYSYEGDVLIDSVETRQGWCANRYLYSVGEVFTQIGFDSSLLTVYYESGIVVLTPWHQGLSRPQHLRLKKREMLPDSIVGYLSGEADSSKRTSTVKDDGKIITTYVTGSKIYRQVSSTSDGQVVQYSIEDKTYSPVKGLQRTKTVYRRKSLLLEESLILAFIKPEEIIDFKTRELQSNLKQKGFSLQIIGGL